MTDDERALCDRPRVGVRITPTAEEVASLAAAHAALMKVPRASRTYPMRQLAEQCAAVGHFGGARALLLQLPSGDMNDRPNAAFRVLHGALTGTMVPAW